MAPVIASINHLLGQEPWARRLLAPHAGKVACIDAGSLALRMRVGGDGMLEAASVESGAQVTIRIKLSDLPLILQNRERAFSYVKIDGDAEFANTISQLSKTLRWEAEHDLEKLVGQIAAARIVSGASMAFEALKTGQRKLAENVAEYFLEEQPLLVRPVSVGEFSADVTRLRDDVERTAKRIEKMERALQAGQAPQSLDLT
ncbi:ubiquinone biosynthesis protein UbiJ [Oxalobacteraceae bacterium GrIS 1.11]